MNDRKSQCCTCGYEWITGRDGSHSCSQEMAKTIAAQQKQIDELMEVVKAVAHIGIDFGFGKYELEQDKIDEARRLYELLGDNNE